MKYQGSIAEVKAIQDEIQKTKLYFVSDDRPDGWELVPNQGVEPTLYTVKLTLLDKSQKFLYSNGKHEGYLFYISFNYRKRDNYGQVWIRDEDTGRLFKVFPGLHKLLATLNQVILPDEQVRITQEKYRIEQELRSGANG